jgi:hypothetical protein
VQLLDVGTFLKKMFFFVFLGELFSSEHDGVGSFHRSLARSREKFGTIVFAKWEREREAFQTWHHVSSLFFFPSLSLKIALARSAAVAKLLFLGREGEEEQEDAGKDSDG